MWGAQVNRLVRPLISRSSKGNAATVLAVVAALVIAPLSAGAATRVGRNYKLDSPPMPLRVRDVPALAVDPSDPRHIVAVSQEYRFQTCNYHVSFDRGKTWTTGELTGPEGWPDPLCPPLDEGGYSHFNATIAFGSGQNVYTTFSAPAPDGADSILVSRSTDGGVTYNPAVVAIRGTAFPPPPATAPDISFIQPTIGVVPKKNGPDEVYIASWGKYPFNGGCSRRTVERGACNHIVSATSLDGGATFTGPVDVNSPEELAREQSQPVMAPNGNLYIAYRGRFGPADAEQTFLRLATSTDKGQTWSLSTISDETGVPLFPGIQPRMAVDGKTGTLYVTYQAHTHGDGDVFVRRSTDGGTTWSDRVRVNDDPIGNGVYQSAPDVLVGKGRVDVVWFDQRHSYPGAISVSSHSGASVPLEDVYFATSRNGGASFGRNVRVTDRTRNLDVGLRDESNFGPFWGAVGAQTGKSKVLVAWADSRLGSVLDDNQDIFLAKVNLKSSGAPAVARIRSRNFVGAAVALSRRAYPGGGEDREGNPASRLVIVNRSDFKSGIVGAVLARFDAGPVLLSGAGGLSKAVRKEIARYEKVAGAYVIGGLSSLSEGVVDDLVAEGVPEEEILRIAGANAADTARLVAIEMDTRDDVAKEAGDPAFSAAVIVNPKSPGAGAATALAAALRYPILFAKADSVPAETMQALDELDIPETILLGGGKVISKGVASRLPGARRIGGTSAPAVSRSVAKESMSSGLPEITIPHNVVYVADSRRRMNSAALGAAVARLGGIQLLVPGARKAAALDTLRDLKLIDEVDRVVIVTG